MAQRKGETLKEYNVRANEYMKRKYFERRDQAIAYLGGACVDCGERSLLEFDHEQGKEFNIAKRLNSAPWNIIQLELDRCSLRCTVCHAHMTSFRKLQEVNILAPVA